MSLYLLSSEDVLAFLAMCSVRDSKMARNASRWYT